MPVNAVYRVEYNRPIARDVFLMRLSGPTDPFVAPGQFVNIHIDGFYLRRPLSVCEVLEDGILLIYKVMGRGTARMAMYAAGTQLDLLAGLGNGFTVSRAKGKKVVLTGGGCGVPPLYDIAKRLAKQDKAPAVVLGFNNIEDAFYKREFEALGCQVHIATMDGTLGTEGTVIPVLETLDYDYYCTCGPQPMLAAVHALGVQKGASGQLSFEARMGCGFGACYGCSCKTITGSKRICKEGPILFSEEVTFS
ncbi:dihydroorotate dehydrogenase electron transfer subunit [Ruminococcaceae bacterium OttesenSCG-928-I18]|nr:dihydroorotate dehydrogenase electron transfer subunit [Ruminococcaceae bacterium OttesenSCG-928-I18]